MRGIDNFNYLLKGLPTEEIGAKRIASQYMYLISQYEDMNDVIGRGVQIQGGIFVADGTMDIIKFDKNQFSPEAQRMYTDVQGEKHFVYVSSGVTAGTGILNEALTLRMELMRDSKKTSISPRGSVSMIVVVRKKVNYDGYEPTSYEGLAHSEGITKFHMKLGYSKSSDDVTRVDSVGGNLAKFDLSFGATNTILLDKTYTQFNLSQL